MYGKRLREKKIIQYISTPTNLHQQLNQCQQSPNLNQIHFLDFVSKHLPINMNLKMIRHLILLKQLQLNRKLIICPILNRPAVRTIDPETAGHPPVERLSLHFVDGQGFLQHRGSKTDGPGHQNLAGSREAHEAHRGGKRRSGGDEQDG